MGRKILKKRHYVCFFEICPSGKSASLLILAEGAIALLVTLSGSALFASWKLLQFPSRLIVKVIRAIFKRASAQFWRLSLHTCCHMHWVLHADRCMYVWVSVCVCGLCVCLCVCVYVCACVCVCLCVGVYVNWMWKNNSSISFYLQKSLKFASGHTASNAPDLFRTPKLSGAGPG